MADRTVERRTIDLNADLGEGGGFDRELLAVVTSASVACGFHAGDEETMRSTSARAVERGVAIGAHVGYRDRDGFGRRETGVDAATIEAESLEQIGALQEAAAAAGGRVAYVKPHGALYHRAGEDAACAAAIVAAAGAAGGLPLLGAPASQLLAAARAAGLGAVAEGFADRGYTPDGTLVPRGGPGAVLAEDDALRQALSLALDGIALAEGGRRVEVEVESICVHGDTPHAAALASRLAAALEQAGVEVRPFT